MKKIIILFLLISGFLANAMGYRYEMCDINNPYPEIARTIKDKSVKKAIVKAEWDGWHINEKKSVTYEKCGVFGSIYFYINPFGHAIAYGNAQMVAALLRKGGNYYAHAYKEGSTIFVPEIVQPFIYKYNAFEYAIDQNQPEIAQLIYNKDNDIVLQGNPLKVALFRAIANTKVEFKIGSLSWLKNVSLFTFVHNLVTKHKPGLDHSLLKIACIDLYNAELTQELIDLNYSTDYYFSTGFFSRSTIADELINRSKNRAYLNQETIASLIAILDKANKFNEKQKTELKALSEARARGKGRRFSSTLSKNTQQRIKNAETYKNLRNTKNIKVL